MILVSISYRFPCDKPLALFLFVYCGLLVYSFLIERWVIHFMHTKTELVNRFACILIPYIFTAQLTKVLFCAWYVVGNIWLWTTETCKTTNPILYWTIFGNFVVSYIVGVPMLVGVVVSIMGIRALTPDPHAIMADAWFLPVTRGLSPR